MAADTPLTNAQKRTLIILAREVWAQMVKCGALDAPGNEQEAFASWRREEQARVLRGARDSLTEARQRDYRPLLAHFLALKGGASTGRAYELLLSAQPEDEQRRQHLFQLGKLAAMGGFSASYLAAIAEDKFGTRDVESLAPGQLIQIMATLRRRLKSKLHLEVAR